MAQVIIIEDDPSIALMLSEILRINGIAATTYADGQSCLSELPIRAPRIIISDMLLPDMPAHELLSRIKQHYKTPDLPAIFMSARTQAEITTSELGSHDVDFLPKPFDTHAFLMRIFEILRNRH